MKIPKQLRIVIFNPERSLLTVPQLLQVISLVNHHSKNCLWRPQTFLHKLRPLNPLPYLIPIRQPRLTLKRLVQPCSKILVA
jgi:hypothetical protein